MIDEKKSCEEKSFLRLLEIIKTLRSENGCPWDNKQTPQSMRANIIEETFELVDALTQNDPSHSMEELGDVFFVNLMVAYMFQQSGDFDLKNVFDEVCEKLLRRHPHVEFDGSLFSQKSVAEKNPGKKSIEEINSSWEKIKTNVEGRKNDFILDGVPKNFPPLLKAYKFLKKAASTGFEWPSVDDAKSKIMEELEEVGQATGEKNPEHLEEEIGDLLLSVVNYSRLLGVNPVVAMENANQKFYKRFFHVDKRMKESNLPQDKSSLKEMEGFWKEAKTKEN